MSDLIGRARRRIGAALAPHPGRHTRRRAARVRPDHDPPAEVRMLTDLATLYTWARARDVRVHLISTDVDGRGIYAAHAGPHSRVTKGPPRERVWYQPGFQT